MRKEIKNDSSKVSCLSLFFNCDSLVFDFRLMGGNFFVPIVGMVGTLLLLIFFGKYGGIEDSMYYLVSQTVIPFVGSWWGYHLIRPIVEDEGGELFFLFPVSHFYLGIVRIIRTWLMYSGLIVIYCICVHVLLGIYVLDLCLALIIQSLFFQSFGFLSLTITCSTSGCWILPTAYVLIYAAFENRYFSFFSVYEFPANQIMINELGALFFIKATAIALICLFAADCLFNLISIRGVGKRF